MTHHLNAHAREFVPGTAYAQIQTGVVTADGNDKAISSCRQKAKPTQSSYLQALQCSDSRVSSTTAPISACVSSDNKKPPPSIVGAQRVIRNKVVTSVSKATQEQLGQKWCKIINAKERERQHRDIVSATTTTADLQRNEKSSREAVFQHSSAAWNSILKPTTTPVASAIFFQLDSADNNSCDVRKYPQQTIRNSCELTSENWWLAVFTGDHRRLQVMIRDGYPWDGFFSEADRSHVSISSAINIHIVSALDECIGLSMIHILAKFVDLHNACEEMLLMTTMVYQLVDQRDRNRKRIALHYAAELGMLSLVQNILRAGSDVFTKDRNGDTALHLACKHGHALIVEALMGEAHGSPSSSSSSSRSPRSIQQQSGQTKSSMANGLNIRNNQGRTALMLTHNHQRSIATTLLRANADMFVVDTQGECFLSLAIESDNASVVRECLRNPRLRKGWIAFMHDRQQQQQPQSLQPNTHPTLSSDWADACWPLHRAVRLGRISVLKALLSSDCFDINAQESHCQSTPLMLACLFGYLDIAKCCLQHHARSGQQVDGQCAVRLLRLFAASQAKPKDQQHLQEFDIVDNPKDSLATAAPQIEWLTSLSKQNDLPFCNDLVLSLLAEDVCDRSLCLTRHRTFIWPLVEWMRSHRVANSWFIWSEECLLQDESQSQTFMDDMANNRINYRMFDVLNQYWPFLQKRFESEELSFLELQTLEIRKRDILSLLLVCGIPWTSTSCLSLLNATPESRSQLLHMGMLSDWNVPLMNNMATSTSTSGLPQSKPISSSSAHITVKTTASDSDSTPALESSIEFSTCLSRLFPQYDFQVARELPNIRMSLPLDIVLLFPYVSQSADVIDDYNDSIVLMSSGLLWIRHSEWLCHALSPKEQRIDGACQSVSKQEFLRRYADYAQVRPDCVRKCAMSVHLISLPTTLTVAAEALLGNTQPSQQSSVVVGHLLHILDQYVQSFDDFWLCSLGKVEYLLILVEIVCILRMKFVFHRMQAILWQWCQSSSSQCLRISSKDREDKRMDVLNMMHKWHGHHFWSLCFQSGLRWTPLQRLSCLKSDVMLGAATCCACPGFAIHFMTNWLSFQLVCEQLRQQICNFHDQCDLWRHPDTQLSVLCLTKHAVGGTSPSVIFAIVRSHRPHCCQGLDLHSRCDNYLQHLSVNNVLQLYVTNSHFEGSGDWSLNLREDEADKWTLDLYEPFSDPDAHRYQQINDISVLRTDFEELGGRFGDDSSDQCKSDLSFRKLFGNQSGNKPAMIQRRRRHCQWIYRFFSVYIQIRLPLLMDAKDHDVVMESSHQQSMDETDKPMGRSFSCHQQIWRAFDNGIASMIDFQLLQRTFSDDIDSSSTIHFKIDSSPRCIYSLILFAYTGMIPLKEMTISVTERETNRYVLSGELLIELSALAQEYLLKSLSSRCLEWMPMAIHYWNIDKLHECCRRNGLDQFRKLTSMLLLHTLSSSAQPLSTTVTITDSLEDSSDGHELKNQIVSREHEWLLSIAVDLVEVLRCEAN